jgi:hypothetical protein
LNGWRRRAHETLLYKRLAENLPGFSLNIKSKTAGAASIPKIIHKDAPSPSEWVKKITGKSLQTK